MSTKNDGRASVVIRLSIYCLGAVAVFLPLGIPSSDLSGFLYFLLAVPSASIALVVLATRRRGQTRLPIIGVLVCYWVISIVVFRHFSEVRDQSRWLLLGRIYKASVLALPIPANGELRRIEWEGWGFAGTGDTVVYLVVDPTDSLLMPAKEHSAGKFKGIPCASYRVRQLESQWYTEAFYTDTEWGRCE